MTPKIPSSLKWLIDKRARLDGEIQKTRASLSTAKRLLDELRELEESLAAIDRSLGMHEIQIEIENIPTIRSHYVRINLPRGELTRSIFLCLKLNEGAPIRMSQFVDFIAARYADIDATKETRAKLSRSVHNRLKTLYHEGKLQRHHPADSNEEGLWSLKIVED